MQQLQHKRITIQHTLSSLVIRYWYVLVGSGFTATENMSNDDRKRPWFER